MASRDAGAEALCAEILGWRGAWVEGDGGAPYLALELGGLSGGIVGGDAARSLWLPYARVPSVLLATERARAGWARRCSWSRAPGPAGGAAWWRPRPAPLALWQPEADPAT